MHSNLIVLFDVYKVVFPYLQEKQWMNLISLKDKIK